MPCHGERGNGVLVDVRRYAVASPITICRFHVNGSKGTERFSEVPFIGGKPSVALVVSAGMAHLVDDFKKRRYGEGNDVQVFQDTDGGLPRMGGDGPTVHVLPPEKAREFHHVDAVAPTGDSNFVLVSYPASVTERVIAQGR